MKKIKVGILGGSFNPPHLGHLHISKLAIKQLNLLQLWWVPTLQNPLKATDIKASYAGRLKLCKELVQEYPKIKVKDLERRFFKDAEKTYSYELLERLTQLYPDHEFCFIIGADSLINFHKWYKYKQIPELAQLVVFDRPGYKQKALNSKAVKAGIEYKFISGKTKKISSTELRKKS